MWLNSRQEIGILVIGYFMLKILMVPVIIFIVVEFNSIFNDVSVDL